jgi:uncharacterized protein (TIGR02266 family)
MSETRRDKRAPLSLKVRFKSATLDEFLEHYSQDISRGGLFIKSKKPMPEGTLLKFELQLKDESSVIHGVGRVVWTRPADGASGDSPAGMGIKFIKMDPESRALVQQIVDARGQAPGTFDRFDENGQPDGSFFPESAPPMSSSWAPPGPKAKWNPWRSWASTRFTTSSCREWSAWRWPYSF